MAEKTEKETPKYEPKKYERIRHVCSAYKIVNDKPVCVYCGQEMEL